MKAALLLFALPLAVRAATPVAGSWQAFTTSPTAETWLVESYFYNDFTVPGWAGPPIDDNPFIFSFYEGNDAVAFVTDASTSGGTLTGDYTLQNIRGIGCDAFFDPSELDFIDVLIYADGPYGPDFYYSEILPNTQFEDGEDWYTLDFLFDQAWYAPVGDDEWEPFFPDRIFRASIEEIDIRFFPRSGIRTESYVGLDNVILLPTVVVPKLQTSLSAGMFRLSFTPAPGTQCSVQKLSEPAMTWQDVTGQTGIVSSHVFQTPATPPRGLFRVEAKERFTPIASP